MAPSGDPATMGTWMGLGCLFMIISSFSSSDLHVASRTCSLDSMLSSLRQMVWLMENRKDCKRKSINVQQDVHKDNKTEPSVLIGEFRGVKAELNWAGSFLFQESMLCILQNKPCLLIGHLLWNAMYRQKQLSVHAGHTSVPE